MSHQLKIDENVILIRVAKLYDQDISPQRLYEITRGIWVIGDRREKAEYVFSVFGGEVKAVYKIASWHNALTTIYQTRTGSEMTQNGDLPINNRHEFIGEISEEMQEKYLGESVKDYFPHGAANPITYINC